MEYFKRFVIWLVSGIGLACGITLVAWVTDHFEKKDPPISIFPKTLPVDSVQVSSIEVIPMSDRFTASASMLSLGKSPIEATLQLDIHDAGRVIYSCGHNLVRYTHPGKPQRVQMDCFGLKRTEVPASATLSVEVTRVEELRP
jgi:hypothetical protein